MAASPSEQTWKLHSPISDLSTSSSSAENPLDWTCEELKGRATALFFPLTDGEVLVQEGDVVVISEQTLEGNYFVIHNKRTGQSGKVPVDYIEIIPEDVDEVPLPMRSRSEQIHSKPERSPQAATFPRISKPVTTTSPSTAQCLEASTTKPKDHRSATVMPSDGTPTEDRRDGRSATVALATGGGGATPDDEGPIPYEAGFKRVEELNIMSVSGADRDGRPVIVFSACRLPPSYTINHDMLLRYSKYVLDKIVEQDYTVLYCHYGLRSYNKPSYSWFRKVYSEMDRKYKKNIKKLYILHPTNFIRIMMSLMKPFINYKFGKKVSYINRLAELEQVLYLDRLDLPDEVKSYDLSLKVPVRHLATSDSRSVFHTPLPYGGAAAATSDTTAHLPTRQFGVKLEKVDLDENMIPKVISTCVGFLEKKGIEVVGIFRRSPATATIQTWKEQFNKGHEVDLESHGDPHLAAVLIKLFLRELPEPLLTFNLYEPILELKSLPAEVKVAVVRDMLKERLPLINFAVLKYLILFLARVAEREEVNKMSASNISIVIGPNLIWGTNPAASLTALGEINTFTLLLINHSSEIFPEESASSH